MLLYKEVSVLCYTLCKWVRYGPVQLRDRS